MTNEDLVRKYYAARSEGLADAFWSEHVAENVAYHLPARTSLGGEFHGKAEVRTALTAIVALSGGTFKLQLLDVTSSSIHAIALVRATARRQGKVLDSRQAHVFEIVDGRIMTIWNYAYDRYAIDAFWN